eukprot:Amastigsp_a677391_7.p4 type:complete len:161 gc:universal Amastigsp_a677391_7:642-160(-)
MHKPCRARRQRGLCRCVDRRCAVQPRLERAVVLLIIRLCVELFVEELTPPRVPRLLPFRRALDERARVVELFRARDVRSERVLRVLCPVRALALGLLALVPLHPESVHAVRARHVRAVVAKIRDLCGDRIDLRLERQGVDGVCCRAVAALGGAQRRGREV